MTRLVIISDTHTREPVLSEGDILIHCGDLTFHGGLKESIRALDWLNRQHFKHRIVIAGNHELGWESDSGRKWLWRDYPHLTFLHNTGVTYEGINFWGSPVQPYFHGWAFQKQRSALAEHWSHIPTGTDVVITHGPPSGFGDTNLRDERFGDKDLLDRILAVKPIVHCYGHAHYGYGTWNFNDIQFINAAVLDEDYNLRNAPWVVDISVNPRGCQIS